MSRYRVGEVLLCCGAFIIGMGVALIVVNLFVTLK